MTDHDLITALRALSEKAGDNAESGLAWIAAKRIEEMCDECLCSMEEIARLRRDLDKRDEYLNRAMEEIGRLSNLTPVGRGPG